MKNISIFITLIVIFYSCGKSTQVENDKPNVVFIMLDDFGYSQIAYNSAQISKKDYDPLFLQYTIENGDYSPEKALEFSRRATPTLSRMASEGMIFTNAFTSSNLCAPSRIAIATGIQQNRWGIYRNIDCEAIGPKPGTLLVEKLQKAGYSTAHIGKWHIGSRDQNMVSDYLKKKGVNDSLSNYLIKKYPEIKKELNENGYMGSCAPEHHALNNGFDYYFGYNTWESPFYNATNVWDGFKFAGINPTYNTDLFTDKAIEFIDKSLEREEPFYVQLHYHAVHAPLDPKAPENYYNQFDSESFNLNNFYAHVYAVDENIKRIENHLSEKGVAKNTIFIFTSDNGGAINEKSTIPGNAPYRGHKGMHLMGGIKVPLFLFWPEGIKKIGNNEQLVSTLDIIPTVLDASGIQVPENLDGKSLLPYLKNRSSKPIHDYLVWSGIHARTWGFMRYNNISKKESSRDFAPYAWVVVKDNYALRYIGETQKGLYYDLQGGKPGYYELYDILHDPGEKYNLITEKPEIFNKLRQIWENESKDYPPPVKIGRDKWENIISKSNKYFKK